MSKKLGREHNETRTSSNERSVRNRDFEVPPNPVALGIADSLLGTAKGIIEIPSAVAELAISVGNKIAEDPVGVAITCINLRFNPIARIELAVNVAGAVGRQFKPLYWIQ
jgi:hypothetical protein